MGTYCHGRKKRTVVLPSWPQSMETEKEPSSGGSAQVRDSTRSSGAPGGGTAGQDFLGKTPLN